MKAIGKTFESELSAAGLIGLPFSWSADGSLNIEQLSAEQRAAVMAVYAAHDPESLYGAKADRLAEINAACDAQVAAIKATYPDTEVQSWPKQEAEARALQENASAHTPLLNAIAAQRGISQAELAAKVLIKSDAFAVFTGAAFGKRQKLEAQIDAAKTIEQVSAISWEAA
jgi:hypothetical protein